MTRPWRRRCWIAAAVLCSVDAACKDSILIVGGGMSALAAARELERQGCSNITLVEASGRLGGRVHTLNGKELGGTYLHGTTSPLAQLVMEHNLPTVVSGGDSAHPGQDSAEWHYEGKVLDKQTTEERAAQLLKEWYHVIQQRLSHYNGTDSVEYLQELSNQVVEEISSNNALDRALMEFELSLNFQHDRGLPFWNHEPTGIYNDWDWVEKSGADRMLVEGMSTLVQTLRQELQHTNVLLDTQVQRISYGNESSCQIYTPFGTLEARYCIVTLPLGVLKRNHDALFSPPLSSEKQDALNRAGVAVFNTLVVEWKLPNLCREVGAYYLLSTTNPLSGGGMVCPDLLRNVTSSNRSITQFYIHGDSHPYSNDTYWKEQAVDVLHQLGNDDVSVEDILDVTMSSWHSDPLFMGSYSVPSTFTRGNVDRQILANSINDVVYFAGEHTHAEGRYQSMDGAYDTGIRAARQLLESMSTKTTHTPSCMKP